MKMSAYFTIISLLLFFSSSYACINHYVIDGNGKEHIYGFGRPTEIKPSYKKDSMGVMEVERHPTGWAGEDGFKYITNYCASLIKLGRFKETIPILKKLLLTHPNEYEINANLAVALELAGEYENAMMYLKKSISIKPNAHNNSEWFHVNVLDAAIKLKNKQLDLTKDKVLTISTLNSREITASQMAYQLYERMPLTKSTNALLSKTIEETGDYFHKNLSLEWAIEFYAMSVAYTADTLVITNLWTKINTSRTKLLTYSKRNKKSSPSKYLFDKNWKQSLTKNFINKWRNYTPIYYSGKVITSF